MVDMLIRGMAARVSIGGSRNSSLLFFGFLDFPLVGQASGCRMYGRPVAEFSYQLSIGIGDFYVLLCYLYYYLPTFMQRSVEPGDRAGGLCGAARHAAYLSHNSAVSTL